MITAAGICLLAPDDVALFLLRNGGRDQAGTWAFAGGGIEGGETPQECAIRETREETGRIADGDLQEMGTTAIPNSDGASFVTFKQQIGAPFMPELSDEHTGFAWCPLTSPPQPLHPGVAKLLKTARADSIGIEPETEMQVAKLIASAQLPSPFPFGGSVYVAVRVSGCGVAWREKFQEYTYRDPSVWTSPEMLERCRGLPVVINHPEGAVLTGDELAMRGVGTTIYSFVRNGEPWAVARLIDEDAGAAISRLPFDTSPSATFQGDNNIRLELPGGERLLIEGVPQTLDHLALLPQGRGVWGEARGNEQGVAIT
jgi:8-oxo-dGTP pyrophosphatase MutT (NUDIX family)